MLPAARPGVRKIRCIAKLLPWFASLAITLVLAEAALRVTGFANHKILHASPPQAMFVDYDQALGWSLTPDVSGVFSNGYFSGRVTIDEHGIRRNSPDGTYREGYQNILFIGDSTTASFEVDDDETVPALLEHALRDRGRNVNVINLGVRAYSTDQVVARAIQWSDFYRPRDIIYLFVDNDIPGNNMFKRARKPFGKGVYIMRDGDESFEALNYPVPHYPLEFGAAVVFDDACTPLVYEYATAASEPVRKWRTKLNRWLRNNVYLYGAIRFVVRSFTGKPDNYDSRGFGATADPYQAVIRDGGEWNNDFGFAYGDGGLIRNRCRTYFDSQLRFLLDRLRTQIPSLVRLHLVQYPDATTINLLRRRERSANTVLFMAMRDENLIDSYINLPAKLVSDGHNIDDFRCTGDVHFCKFGTAWIASEILGGIALD